MIIELKRPCTEWEGGRRLGGLFGLSAAGNNEERSHFLLGLYLNLPLHPRSNPLAAFP